MLRIEPNGLDQEMLRVEPKPLPATTTTGKCTLGCPNLDELLAGGIPCGVITEIVGESSAGKTQICLQLVLAALLPSTHGGVSSSSVYIHSEFPFPVRRLQSLSISLPFSSSLPPSPLDHVHVRGVYSANDLLAILDRLPPFLLSHQHSSHPIRLVLIDSIAAVFRADFDCNPTDMRKRSSLFFAISGKLRELARNFGLAVVVTNQVTDLVNEEEVRIGNYKWLRSSGRKVAPALGLRWASCVNVRLFLSITASGEEEGTEFHRRRKMMVVFAPHLAEGTCDFVIKKDGIFGFKITTSTAGR